MSVTGVSYEETEGWSTLTPEAGKENEDVVHCLCLLNETKDSDDCASEHFHRGRCAGDPSSANSISNENNNDDGGDVDARGDTLDCEWLGNTCLLEEVSAKAREEGKTEELLGEIGPESCHGASAVGASEDGHPTLAFLLNCDSFFVFRGENQDLELLIDVVIGYSAVQLLHRFAGSLVVLPPDTPGW
jgi:hypothetical protein